MSSSTGTRARRFAVAAVSVLALALTSGAAAQATGEPTPGPVHVIDTAADLDTRPYPAPANDGATDERFRARATTLGLSVKSLCHAPSPTPVRDGQPIVVSLPPAAPFTVGDMNPKWWGTPPSPDNTWRLWFYSSRWAQTVMHRAYVDGQPRSMTAIVDQVLSLYAQHPDAGDGRPTRLGWDEGASLRRLETLNCLYAATKDRRIVTAMTSEVGVLSGRRYYGPPYAGVHNHGLMANTRMVLAGKLVGREAWVDLARRRMASEAPRAFTKAGTTYEQSSSYHNVNYLMWRNAADMLESLDPRDPAVASIRTTLGKARRVVQWLTEPDGKFVQIGSATRTAGERGGGMAGTFRDDQAGLLVGRWSWADPNTTYYTLRYGPRRWAHGHFDKGSLTWSTLGARVLVGPGYTTHDAQSPTDPWHRSMVAHNTSAPVSGRFDPKAVGILTSASRSVPSPVHSATVQERSYGHAHRRSVTVDHARRTLTVGDSYARGVRSRQTWHLDPSWTLVSAPANGTQLRFRNPAGRTLTIATTGRLSGAVRGQVRPQAGWTFLSVTDKVPSWQITLRSLSHGMTTTFKVT